MKSVYSLKDRRSGETIRNSSIELLKIFGIFLIVVNHVVQKLCEKSSCVPYNDYILNLSVSTTDVQQLILSILRYSGVIGNTIFFMCSAWFLLDSKKFSGKKWFFMLFEIWVISVAILAITYIARSGDIDRNMVIKCLMPTTFETNWYMTCYLLFYPIHGFLNKIIKNMSQKQLFRSATILAVLYIGISFIKGGLFYTSLIVLWITIYFVIAYVKFYLPDMCSERKINIALLCFGIAGHLGIILLTNFLGLRIGGFSNKLLYWNKNCNPFIIISVFAMLNLARSIKFHNRFINGISKLSMLIYIIHENIILRKYYRPYAIRYIYENYGYSHVLLWMILLSIAIFIGAAIISFIYSITLRKLVNKLSQVIYNICCAVWRRFEEVALKLH